MPMIDSFSGYYRFLSNFWPTQVVYDGMTFYSTETAYQAAKFPHRPVLQRQIQQATPGESKRLSRTAECRSDWDEVKLEIMEDLLRQKFSRNPLKTQLLNTGVQTLIEGNHWGDVFWGVCKGVGENNLGKLLMKIRGELAVTT